MKTYKIFIMLLLALAVNACQDKETVSMTPALGEDVQFGLSLSRDALARTIYGPEGDKTFPIYWVNGDKVAISAPNCLAGRNTATYSVAVSAATQNYADELNKVGAAGIQWGDANSKFYSVYPSDYVVGMNGAKFSVKMPNQQHGVLDENNNYSPDMKSCFMTAATDEINNGAVVQLGYEPLSTAVRFTVQGPAQGTQLQEPVQIQKVELVAPETVKISGKFEIDFTNGTPVLKADKDSSFSTVTVFAEHTGSGAHLTLAAGETAELNAFLLLEEDVVVDENWKIVVTLTTGKEYTKSLSGNANSGKNKKLISGMVHRLPTLPNIENLGNFDPANWMVNIPRNVYLSEISIPGSWNSLNKDFQSDISIDNQYEVGVRAFHLDCRWRASSNGALGQIINPTIAGLSVCDGTTSYSVLGEDGRVLGKSASTIESCLAQITANVKNNEYMLVFCSFAHDSFDGSGKYGKTWMQTISDACNADENIIDARSITANTTVGSVLGKVIVIVNCENAISGITLPTNSKCLFTYLPNKLTEAQFPSTGYNSDALYSSSSSSIGITLANSQAQISSSTGVGIDGTRDGRGYYPAMAERTQVVNNILDWSKNNYTKSDYDHNEWIFLGLGGSQRSSATASDANHSTIASTYSKLISDRIKNMAAKPTGDQTNFYPVGIVFQNFCTGTSKGAVNDILQLNNKYRKAYDPNYVAPISNPEVKSAAPGYSSGMTDNNTNAFSWDVE